ncbi:MAG: hypothetical protein ACTSWQ_00455 [Candidatus Thorarchaeota archaeon]
MPKSKTPQEYFIVGLFVVVMCIISSLLVALIFLAPSVLIVLAGLPLWPLLLISVPVGFAVLGWVVLTIGRFRRR